VSPYSGGKLLTLYGMDLSSVLRLSVAGRSVSFSVPKSAYASTNSDVGDIIAKLGLPLRALDFVTFTSPNLLSPMAGDGTGNVTENNPIPVYQVLSLDVLVPEAGSVVLEGVMDAQQNYSQLLLYTSSICIAPGVWKEDGVGGCLPCPTGGYWSVWVSEVRWLANGCGL
jgi:hypothetical protein